MEITDFEPVDKPEKIELEDPVTREPLRDEDGNIPYLLLYGRDSQIYQKRQRTIANRQIKASERMRKFTMGTSEQTERDTLETAVACTAGWGHLTHGGKPLEFTEENAMMVYQKVPFILEQATEAILDRARFFRKSQESLSREQSGSSNSPVPLREAKNR